MQSALCVDQLLLEGVALPLHKSGAPSEVRASNNEELPILATHSSCLQSESCAPKRCKKEDEAEARSETVTTTTDEEDDAPPLYPRGDDASVPESTTTATRTVGFLERVMREYSVRREIQALISKKQQQLKHMQLLITAYTEQLLHVISSLEDHAQQLTIDQKLHSQKARSKLAELLATGASRVLVETTRCLGLLQQQKYRILHERSLLQIEIIRTRQEECEWLRKSIQTQHDDECELLLSPATAKKFLEQGSLQATLAVQITEHDPIFAAVEQLLESPPQAKQLQLQLESVDAVLASMQLKRDEMEISKPNCTPGSSPNSSDGAGPVPLVKRSSFRERRLTEAFPTADRKRAVRLALLEAKRVRVGNTGNSTKSTYAAHESYTDCLRRAGRLMEDMRTRSGRLLHQFSEQLHDDTIAWVRVRVQNPPHDTGDGRASGGKDEDAGSGNQDHHDTDTNGSKASNAAATTTTTATKQVEDDLDRYYIPRLAELLAEPPTNADTTTTNGDLYECYAVDCSQLPPPAMVSAFATFLLRVISTEYELQTITPLPLAPKTAHETGDSDDNNDDETGTFGAHRSATAAVDQAVLQDCVHEMAFTRIHAVACASAMEQSRFHDDNRSQEPEQSSHHVLFPWHWRHAKQRIQQLSPEELAFPDDVLDSVTRFLSTHSQMIHTHGFLPDTLAMFRVAERETTPRGVVRAVMAGFRMLHQEIIPVLSAEVADEDEQAHGHDDQSDTVDGQQKSPQPQQRRRRRRGSCFLNADVLIPSLVLMMCRLPHPRYLDRLWLQTKLVEAFRTAALSEGGEEAYYLTCLAAAIEFILTYEPGSMSGSSSDVVIQECVDCERLRSRHVAIAVSDVASVASAPSGVAVEPLQRSLKPRSASAPQPWGKTEHDSIKKLSKWISSQPPTDPAPLLLLATDAERFVASSELWTATATT